ncbi:collagen beta(1-O)galactosyltransferase 1, partial [Columba livia]
MVHSTFLLDLRREATRALAFYPPHPHYTGAFDDIIVFAFSCRQAGVQMFVSNRAPFGFLPVPLRSQSSLRDEAESFLHVTLEIMVKNPPAEPTPHIWVPPKVPDKMGFDEEIAAKLVEAVECRALNSSQVEALGVRMLPGYRDPYHGRPLTRGELGCFLSHHRVWQEIATRGLSRSLVFEDDLRFEIFFKRRLTTLMRELEAAALPCRCAVLASCWRRGRWGRCCRSTSSCPSCSTSTP